MVAVGEATGWVAGAVAVGDAGRGASVAVGAMVAVGASVAVAVEVSDGPWVGAGVSVGRMRDAVTVTGTTCSATTATVISGAGRWPASIVVFIRR